MYMLAMLQKFFMWCTIINVALLILSSLLCIYAGDWVYKKQGKMFSISRDTFNVAIYSFIGLFKIFILIFNLVPYIACAIIS